MFLVHFFYPDLLYSLNYCDIVIISLIFFNIQVKFFQFEQNR